MKQIKKHIYIKIAVLFMTLFLLSGLFLYYEKLSHGLKEQNIGMLNEVLDQQAYNFELKLQKDIENMKTKANITAKYHHYDQSNIANTVDHLQTLIENSEYKFLFYVDANGNGIGSDGSTINVADQSFFQLAFQGQSNVSNPSESKINDLKVIVVSAPIYGEDTSKINAVLFGVYRSEELDKRLLASLNNESYVFVTDNVGTIIAKSDHLASYENDNIYEYFIEKQVFSSESVLEDIKNNLNNKIGGNTTYTVNNDTVILLYENIDESDWLIFSITPDKIISKFSNQIITLSTVFCLLVALTFASIAFVGTYVEYKSRKKLEQIAYFDKFTKAPNIEKFIIDAQKTINEADSGTKFVLVKFDIENFRLLNRILGTNIGNEMLISIVECIRDLTPGKYYRYARVRDDEFLVLHKYKTIEDVYGIRNTFKANVFKRMGNKFNYNAKIVSGHYYMTEDGCKNIKEAIELVNVAHRKAKKQGLEISIYNSDLIQEDIKNKEIENKMDFALINNEFKVFLQPKYKLDNENLAGAEALVRWYYDDKAIAYPSEFIPIFEENGFIIKLDLYMFEEVCKIIKNWIDNDIEPIPISVNFSRMHFNDTEFIKKLVEITDKYNTPHNLLEVELLETTVIDNNEVVNRIISDLHSEGFIISMDDFGVGHSSLGVLRDIDIDVIKLDRSFFLAATDDTRVKSVLKNVISLAKDLEIDTVAEGVEEKVYIDLLREMGCNLVQGYYYSKPLDLDTFEKTILNMHNKKDSI